MNTTRFQVQQHRYGNFVADVGSPYVTRNEAEAECSAAARADWERTGCITPVDQYVIIEVA